MARGPKKKAKRVWEHVKLYSVQCSKCTKWRLIPKKEKYEEIRERIVEESFQCERAREWRPNISCDDESDVKQDGSLCWGIDKPSIPRTPTGWQRITRIRSEGGTRFADIFYVSPSNKRLRSMVELERYLAEHPKYKKEGIDISRFSFQSPAPLDADYLSGKRRAGSTSQDIIVSPTSHISPTDNVSTQSNS